MTGDEPQIERTEAMPVDRPLADTWALVTGASRGIGRATARHLADLGARVALVARSREALDALARETDGWALPCDVADPDAIEAMAHSFRKEVGGPPEILVVSAGVFDLAPAESTPLEVLDRNLNVNLRGAVLSVRAFLAEMKASGRGTIVQVGSVAGRKAFPGNAAYSASKYGIRGFHEVLLEELRGTGVRASLVEPAATDTPIWDPMDPDQDPNLPGRDAMLAPERVAEAIGFIVTRPHGVQIPFLPVERS